MANIVYASLKTGKSGTGLRPSRNGATLKTVSGPDGSRHTLTTVNADSPAFSEDLTAAFKRNVSRARRENKRLVGVTGGAS